MRTSLGLILIVALAALAGCRGGDAQEEPTPETVALGLFDVAQQTEPDDQRIDTLFGSIESERNRAELLDAIRSLPTEGSPVIVDSYELDERMGFDLEVALPSEGAARFSVLVDAAEPPGRIVWFSGPSIEWPERRRRGTGLTTSAPPEGR